MTDGIATCGCGWRGVPTIVNGQRKDECPRPGCPKIPDPPAEPGYKPTYSWYDPRARSA